MKQYILTYGNTRIGFATIEAAQAHADANPGHSGIEEIDVIIPETPQPSEPVVPTEMDILSQIEQHQLAIQQLQQQLQQLNQQIAEAMKGKEEEIKGEG